VSQNHPEELTVARSLAYNATGSTTTTASTSVCGWSLSNSGAAAIFLKLYNKATAATSADTPVVSILVPAGQTVSESIPGGIRFSAGLSIRSVTTAPDNGNTGAASGELLAQVFYGLK
jgi:hypothetical protein